jgi:hypothetical protein
VWTTFNPSTSMTSNRAVAAYQALVKLRPDQTIDTRSAHRRRRREPRARLSRDESGAPVRAGAAARAGRPAKSSAVWIGFGAALLILVVACANLASLLLGELPERRRDFALREALGASRGRLLRQLAIESLLLSAASAAVGTFLARLAVESLKRAADLPRLDAIRFDLPVTAAVAAAAAATALAARVVPFGRLLHTRDELRPSVSSYATSAPMLRRTMVIVQLALAVVLSSSAILLAVSFRRLVLVDPGFVTAHALAARVSAFPARHPAQADVTRFVNDLAAELEALPEIDRAAASSAMPLTGSAMSTSVGVGRPAARHGRSRERGLANGHAGLLRGARHPAARGTRLRARRPRTGCAPHDHQPDAGTQAVRRRETRSAAESRSVRPIPSTIGTKSLASLATSGTPASPKPARPACTTSTASTRAARCISWRPALSRRRLDRRCDPWCGGSIRKRRCSRCNRSTTSSTTRSRRAGSRPGSRWALPASACCSPRSACTVCSPDRLPREHASWHPPRPRIVDAGDRSHGVRRSRGAGGDRRRVWAQVRRSPPLARFGPCCSASRPQIHASLLPLR